MSNPVSSLTSILSELNSNPPPPASQITSLLSSAKRHLLTLDALLPTPTSPPEHLRLARSVLETGALLSIQLHELDAFTRYFLQLQPFYELQASSLDNSGDDGGDDGSPSQRSKITGLYLLLLLTKGDYAGFHTVLEGLDIEGASHEEGIGMAVEDEEEAGGDKYIQYPIKLERWLMEGSYDRVWGATKREGVPSEEFGEFSEVLIDTIRSEIASCSEKAYPSLPIASAKNLLFLPSEGSVVEFAHERDWLVKDGRIYFPLQQADAEGRTEKDILVASGQVIENTIGYARELETIV